MLSRIRFKAIILCVVASFVAGVFWSLASALALYAQGHSSSASTLATPLSNPTFVLLSFVGAFGSAFVAGWVSARLAAEAEIENSLAAGVLIVLISAAAFVPLGMSQNPLWYNLPAFTLIVPMSLLGGLARRQSRTKAAA